jgi:hypothetical protein
VGLDELDMIGAIIKYRDSTEQEEATRGSGGPYASGLPCDNVEFDNMVGTWLPASH